MYRSFSYFWPLTEQLSPFKASVSVEVQYPSILSLKYPGNLLPLLHLLNKSTTSDAARFRKIATFCSPAYSVIPLFLQWLNQIFLPLHLAFSLLWQWAHSFYLTWKCVWAISASLRNVMPPTLHWRKLQSSFRQLKWVPLSVSIQQARGSCCATRLPGEMQDRQHHPQQI